MAMSPSVSNHHEDKDTESSADEYSSPQMSSFVEFLQLPRELRDYIYYLYFECDNHTRPLRPLRPDRPGFLRKLKRNFSLLFVNKQLFNEANTILLRKSRVMIDTYQWTSINLPPRHRRLLESCRYLDISIRDPWTSTSMSNILSLRDDIRTIKFDIIGWMLGRLSRRDEELYKQEATHLLKWKDVKVCMFTKVKGPYLSDGASRFLFELQRDMRSDICRCQKSENGKHVGIWI